MASQPQPADREGDLAKMAQLDLSDCICPICLCIFIEPVTMPCEHDLCMDCFKQNVQESSLSCPLCRKRISTWTRRAVRNNSLINEKKWAAIKRQFPEKVQNKLLDIEDEEVEEMKDIQIRSISQPGEIQKEYEKELKKLQDEALQKQELEEAASRKLIESLQEQEEQAQKERETLALSDEVIARELNQKLKKEKMETPEVRNFLQEKRKGLEMKTPTFLEKFLSKSKDPGDKETYPYTCFTPGGKDKGQTLNSIHPVASNCSISEIFKEARSDLLNISTCTTPSDKRNVNCLDDLPNIPLLPQVKLDMEEDEPAGFLIDPDEDSLGFSSVQIKHAIEESKKESAFISTHDSILNSDAKPGPSNEKSPVVINRSNSTVSNDSISQELVHFKPIDKSPRTPPKRLAGGRLQDPPIIRSTPRNISDLIRPPVKSTGVIAESLGSSPIMRKRLSQLAAERNEKVRRMSKSTSTAVLAASSEERNEKTLSPSIMFLGEERVDPCPGRVRDLTAGASPTIIDLCDTPSPWLDDSSSITNGVSPQSPKAASSAHRACGKLYRMKKHSMQTASQDTENEVQSKSNMNTPKLCPNAFSPGKGANISDNENKPVNTVLLPSDDEIVTNGDEHCSSDTKSAIEYVENSVVDSNMIDVADVEKVETPINKILRKHGKLKLEVVSELDTDTDTDGCSVSSSPVRRNGQRKRKTRKTEKDNHDESHEKGSHDESHEKTANGINHVTVEGVTERICKTESLLNDNKENAIGVNVVHNRDKVNNSQDNSRSRTPSNPAKKPTKCSKTNLKQLKKERSEDIEYSPTSTVKVISSKFKGCLESSCKDKAKNTRKGTSAVNPAKGKSSVQTKLNFTTLSVSRDSEEEFQSEKPSKQLVMSINSNGLYPDSSSPKPTQGPKRTRNASAKSSRGKQGTLQEFISGQHCLRKTSQSSEKDSENEQNPPSKRRKKSCVSTSEDSNHSTALSDECPGVHTVRLERQDFKSDAEYAHYAEEQDRLFALQLQADFDMENKYRLNALRKKGTDGEYELRRTRAQKERVSC